MYSVFLLDFCFNEFRNFTLDSLKQKSNRTSYYIFDNIQIVAEVTFQGGGVYGLTHIHGGVHTPEGP